MDSEKKKRLEAAGFTHAYNQDFTLDKAKTCKNKRVQLLRACGHPDLYQTY